MKSITILLFLLTLLISCAKEDGSSDLIKKTISSDDTDEESVTLSSLVLSSSKTSYNVGESATLKAVGVYSDGSKVDLTSSVLWSSSDEGVVTISGSVASALSAGAVTITANSDDVSSTLVLVPFSATISSIELSEDSLSLPLDANYELSVYALYDNGLNEEVTDEASFSIDDGAIASIDSEGVITSLSSGSAIITADFNGQSTSLNLTVSSATISSLQVTPIVGSKGIGMSQAFYATANLDDGTTLDMTSTVDWSSSNDSILSIDSEGKASLITSGSVSVSASYSSFSSSVNFTVEDKSIDSIEVSLSSDSLTLSTTGEATCTAHYTDGSSEDITDSVSFSSSDQGVAIVSNNNSDIGSLTPLAEGSTTISVSFEGYTDSSVLSITSASLVSISITTLDSLLSAGINAYFFAEGTFDDGSTIDITNDVVWSLSSSSYGSISNSSKKGFYTNTFSESSTTSLTISAQLDSITGSLDIILAPGSITSISITPSTAVLNTYQNLQYAAYAHFDDGASVDITTIANWQSTDTSLAIASNSYADAGTVSTLSEGNVTIYAEYGGLTSNSSSVDIDDSQTPEVSDEGDGLLANYYSGKSFDTLAGTRVDSTVDFDWATGSAPMGVGNTFSVRWSGYIKGKETGDCTVATRSDDGIRVYVGGNLIIDVWSDHASRYDYDYAVPFVEGEKQEITVEFYENGGHALVELYWQCPSDSGLEIVPTEYLFSN